MLQSLLKDRFGLTSHFKEKSLRGYHLVVAKNFGADTLAGWLVEQGFTCQRTGTAKGFRVLQVRPGG